MRLYQDALQIADASPEPLREARAFAGDPIRDKVRFLLVNPSIPHHAAHEIWTPGNCY